MKQTLLERFLSKIPADEIEESMVEKEEIQFSISLPSLSASSDCLISKVDAVYENQITFLKYIVLYYVFNI